MTQPFPTNVRKGKVVRVVDADTLDILFDLGFRVYMVQRIRLARIDAPERFTQEGMDATEFVRDQLVVPQVIVETFDHPNHPDFRFARDYYGEVWLDTGQNLNDLMVTEGHAVLNGG